MKAAIKLRQFVGIRTNLIFLLTISAYAQGSLTNRVIGNFSMQSASVIDVLKKLSSQGIRVGVEAVNDTRPLRIEVDLNRATVGDVLHAVIQADSRYEWKESKETINVFPKEATKTVFDIFVNGFEARGNDATQMIDALLGTTAVHAYLSNRNLTAGTWVTGSLPLQRRRVSLLVNHETLRQALNGVLVKTESVYWCAFYQKQKDKTYLWFQVW